jgi:hypothetical protein
MIKAIDERDLIDLSNGTNTENLILFFESLNNSPEIINEINKNTLKYYIPKYIPVVIILGIFQIIFIVLCILLLRIG